MEENGRKWKKMEENGRKLKKETQEFKFREMMVLTFQFGISSLIKGVFSRQGMDMIHKNNQY
jgi:hypothetical protein